MPLSRHAAAAACLFQVYGVASDPLKVSNYRAAARARQSCDVHAGCDIRVRTGPVLADVRELHVLLLHVHMPSISIGVFVHATLW
jgi:hypothetical protein